MASGLIALLDDVAGIAKIAATSLDDVAAAAGKAGTKAVGVVVDDTAVTPAYAMGFTPDRELPIVAKIAVGSLRNKFFFLLPGALLLSAFAPWAVTPLLMLGGSYLCFEAAEKIFEVFTPEHEGQEPGELALSSFDLEKQKVGGAIRTDLILSAEIMAISLAEVADQTLPIQAAALAVTALLITIGVYGVVALIVKMDDIGLHLAKGGNRAARGFGRGLVRLMPVVMQGLASAGTAAMLWVGGGIIVHGLHVFHLETIPALIESLVHAAGAVPVIGAATGWAAGAGGAAVVGAAVGGVIAGVMHIAHAMRKAH